MNRIRALNGFQKGVLVFLGAMVLIFTILYPIVISREGYEYNDTILVPSEVNGNTVYTGKIRWKEAKFIVREDKTVVFQYDGKTYGPYTAKEDPTALPDHEITTVMTGVELRCGEEIIFRGGVSDWGEYPLLMREDGSLENWGITYTNENGVMMDADGNVIDQMEPSAAVILELMATPKLVHKGDWTIWFGGVFVCVITALSILFVDELFRWNLSFQIRNADRAEPSEWEIAERYIGWIVLPVMALVVFVIGIL